VSSVVVTEDTIQASKKMLAASRKVVNSLDTKRKDIKKSILASYSDFEKQVNELKKIVDDADKIVRGQVKALEEMEREQKQTATKEIWDKRIPAYEIAHIPNLFERFLTPQHLNKSISMTKVEAEMTAFLEDIQKQSESLLKVYTDTEEAQEAMTIFIDTLDLPATISAMDKRKADKEAARKLQESLTQEAPTAGKEQAKTVTVTFIVPEKELDVFLAVLNQNHLTFAYSIKK
jgi:hypothetical protein